MGGTEGGCEVSRCLPPPWWIVALDLSGAPGACDLGVGTRGPGTCWPWGAGGYPHLVPNWLSSHRSWPNSFQTGLPTPLCVPSPGPHPHQPDKVIEDFIFSSHTCRPTPPRPIPFCIRGSTCPPLGAWTPGPLANPPTGRGSRGAPAWRVCCPAALEIAISSRRCPLLLPPSTG